MHDEPISTFQWLGSERPHLDQPFVTHCGDVMIGCYGGNVASGAHKNEDAALVWKALQSNWTLALLLDAHTTSQSAALVLATLQAEQARIVAILARPLNEALAALHQFLIDLFASEAFKTKCSQVTGETACLICVQKEQFLYWLSIGDNQVFLLHPEFAHLGQYALNQRQFYEWLGKVNTFDLPVPSYTSGVRELRQGENRIILITDGVLECGSRPFADMRYFYEVFGPSAEAPLASFATNILKALEQVHTEQGRDSATIIGWQYNSHHPGRYPS